MHQTLYRKYRPTTFDEVVGQEPVTSVLSYEVAHEQTTHAYLLCGSRGTGKTSCAKILARAVNCLAPVNGSPCGICEACRLMEAGGVTDILEMDAASNNGVDYIREIRDEVVYPPAMLKNRVYIIDEVHMLSQGAFNALLKTLEEPPPHVVFILATTELPKIPATILSRCQRFDFRRIHVPVIASRLRFIAEAEGIQAEEEALSLMAKLAHGGMRDAISLLELCAGAGSVITSAAVRDKVGIGGTELLHRLITALTSSDIGEVFTIVGDLYGSSVDLAAFWQEFTSYLRDLLVVKAVPESERFLDVTGEELETLRHDASLLSKEKILWFSRVADDAYQAMQRAGEGKRVIAEMALVRLCEERLSGSSDALGARIAALEEAMRNGVPSVPAAPQTGAFSAPAPSGPKGNAVTAEKPAEASPGKTEPPSESASVPEPQSAAGDRVPFDYLPELSETLAQKDEAAASLLRLASLAVGGGKLYIEVHDAFASMLLGSEETRKEIAAAAASLPGFDGITAQQVVIEVRKAPAENDPLSEF